MHQTSVSLPPVCLSRVVEQHGRPLLRLVRPSALFSHLGPWMLIYTISFVVAKGWGELGFVWGRDFTPWLMIFYLRVCVLELIACLFNSEMFQRLGSLDLTYSERNSRLEYNSILPRQGVLNDYRLIAMIYKPVLRIFTQNCINVSFNKDRRKLFRVNLLLKFT